MIKTIIVDNNQAVVNDLVDYFGKISSIKVLDTFNDGIKALNFILNNSNEIDLILMDLLIPGLDGLALLDELEKNNIKKRIIVLSSYKDENIIRQCSEHHVSYYIIKPFSVISLENRISDIFNFKITTRMTNENLDLEISQILHNLGIPSHIRGYKYIREGVMYIYNNDNVSLITKDIYPRIAEKFCTTPSRVERAIRHAIEVSWIRGDLALMEDLFGFSVSCDKAKPTNSEFLTTIADRIKMDHK